LALGTGSRKSFPTHASAVSATKTHVEKPGSARATQSASERTGIAKRRPAAAPSPGGVAADILPATVAAPAAIEKERASEL